jgi:hypothetical protein
LGIGGVALVAPDGTVYAVAGLDVGAGYVGAAVDVGAGLLLLAV